MVEGGFSEGKAIVGAGELVAQQDEGGGVAGVFVEPGGRYFFQVGVLFACHSGLRMAAGCSCAVAGNRLGG